MFNCLHCNNGFCRKYSTLDVDVPCSGNGDCEGYEVVDEFGFPHWASEAAYNNGYAKGYAEGKAEVVHGEWFIGERNYANRTCDVECSECGAILNLRMFDFGLNYNYCPNCGAKMDGDGND